MIQVCVIHSGWEGDTCTVFILQRAFEQKRYIDRHVLMNQNIAFASACYTLSMSMLCMTNVHACSICAACMHYISAIQKSRSSQTPPVSRFWRSVRASHHPPLIIPVSQSTPFTRHPLQQSPVCHVPPMLTPQPQVRHTCATHSPQWSYY